MPIEVGIWKLGAKLERVRIQPLDSEARLEDSICEDLSIIAPDLMLIGRQIPTDFGKYIDLLAMDVSGNLTVIELKRDRTPREVVAQVFDYASWVQNLSYDEIAELYASKNGGKALEAGFAEAFDTSPPEKLNERHSLIIVSSEPDAATERIIKYLTNNYGVPINAIFRAATKRDPEPWNGQDFYINFGGVSVDGETVYRSWEDARKYGFVSAGGGKWYSQKMKNLTSGARVFVNIPGHGYAGVGKVTEAAVPVSEFTVELGGKKVPFLQAPLSIDAEMLKARAADPDKRDLFVRVEWIKAVPKAEAYWEKGMFASQHPACKLRDRFTLERLVEHFQLGE